MIKLPSNKIIIGSIFGLLIVVILLNTHSGKTNAITAANTPAQDSASGDTNNEVLHELSAQYQQVLAQNKKYQQTIDTLNQTQHLNATSSLNLQGNKTVQNLLAAQQKTEAQLQALEAQIQNQKTTAGTATSSSTYPVNGENTSSNTNQSITTVTDLAASTKLTVKNPIFTQDNNKDSTTQHLVQPITTVPYYTIPALSNLANTSLMTALIGEVPSGNSFSQPPFPFLALVGRKELLAANGLYLPADLAGMKVSGYSVGVGSFIQGISCVRSYVTKVLFVFQDGHFVTYGKDETGTSVDPNDTLGYLSDPYGNPCMQGQYITNASRVLTLLTGVGIVAGASQGLAQAQTTTMTGFDGTSTSFNGSAGKYALGYGLSYSANKATDYILDRLKGTFDVVYIPASHQGIPTPVVVNFSKTIPIDDNLMGRKLNYDHNNNALGATSHRLD